MFRIDPTRIGTRSLHSTLFAFLVLAALGVTWIAYSPGLHGPFLLDDYTSIVDNPYLAIKDLDGKAVWRSVYSGVGPLGRPISMLTFGINAHLFGIEPYFFKLTNLLIHLITGCAIFLLCRLILTAHGRVNQPNLQPHQIGWISLTVAAAWLLHPLNLTGVLYVVQRMTSLATLFTVISLFLYCSGRLRQMQARSGGALILLSLFVFIPLAAYCKENGLLAFVYMLILELTLFRFQPDLPRVRYSLYGLFILTLAVPVLLLSIHTALDMEWITRGYDTRYFTLGERLLTEARALWYYIRLILAPSIGEMGFYHDDFAVSRGWLIPWTTLPAVLGLIFVLAIALLCRHRAPICALGILLFLAAHLMESTVFSLELVQEHRNYFATFGILLPVFYYSLLPWHLCNSLRVRAVAAVAFIGFAAVLTLTRAGTWGDPLRLHLHHVLSHPASPRAHTTIGQLYATAAKSIPDDDQEREYRRRARIHFATATALRSDYTNGLFSMIILDLESGQSFDAAVADELVMRLESQPLNSDTLGWLRNLVSHQANPKFKLPISAMMHILNAPLRNGSISSARRAAVYALSCEYAFKVLRNTQEALTLAQLAVDTAPKDPQLRALLAELLTYERQHRRALQELEMAATLDESGFYADRISSLIDLARRTVAKGR
jgi:hypothetical protein